MNTLNKTRHLIVVMFMIAMLFGQFAGAVSAADDATPAAESATSSEATPPFGDTPDDVTVTPTPAPADEADAQPTATVVEGSSGDKKSDSSAEAPATGNENAVESEPTKTKDAGKSGSTDAVINFAPTAGPDFYSALQNTPLSIAAPGVLANDSDPEGTQLTVGFLGGSTNGTVNLNGNGSFVFTPTTGFIGTASFTYRAKDADGHFSPEATVTIVVKGPPVANDDSFTTHQDTALTIAAPGVLANDTDPEDDPIHVSNQGSSTNGTVSLNSDGSFVFTPTPGFTGTASFTYEVADAELTGSAATVTIEVSGNNEPPVAGDDSYTVKGDTILTVDAPGVLANDSDPNDDPLVVAGVAAPGLPANGTIEADTLNADGSFRYLPRPGFIGTDTFNYIVSDGGLTDVGTVTITVTAPNQPPVAVDDSYGVAKGTTLTVDAPGILANDTDADGDTLTLESSVPPAHGTLNANEDGSFTYTPETGFIGDDIFTYVATDGFDPSGSSNLATVTITVNNTPPVVVDDSYTIAKDTFLTVDAAHGVLANDSDPDGDPLIDVALMFTGPPANGTLQGDRINADGSFSYTPNPGFTGTDSFNYGACDDFVCNFATVTFTVGDAPGNQAPVAVDDSYATLHDTQLTVEAASGLLANDSDPDGDGLAVDFASGQSSDPAHGTVLDIDANGSFLYEPDAGFVGTDTFTYRATDGTDFSNLATVTITVTAAPSASNEPPTGHADKYKTVQDAPLTVEAAKGVLVNDTDADGDKLKAQLATTTAHGSLTLNSDGSFTYTPEKGFKGKDQFSYCPSDGFICGAPVSVQITVSKSASKSTKAEPSPTPESSPSAENEPNADIPTKADNSPSAEHADRAEAAPAPSSAGLQPTPNDPIAIALPITGAGPGAKNHEPTSWLPLAALAVLFVGCSAGFARRRSKR